MTEEQKNDATEAAHGGHEHVHGPDCDHDHADYDEREPIEALQKLGDLFEKVVHDVQPRRVIAEVQRGDRAAYFRHFKGQRLEKFSRRKMTEILHKEVFGRENIFMAQLLMILWNEAHRELYIAMRNHVQTINEDVETIERIEDDKAREFIADLVEKSFTRDEIYICVRLNDVRFGEDLILAELAVEPEPVAAATAEA